jgi:hypothetical protein
MIVAYCAVSWALSLNAGVLQPIARWFLFSKGYKVQLLAQPESANGMLKHIEWDVWGFPGAGNTTVYLVVDPIDSLSLATKSHSSGKFAGIPCAVSRVRRLESHYYSALFYTIPIGIIVGREDLIGFSSTKTRILIPSNQPDELKIGRGSACPLPF